ncbi:MAG: BMP family ABC transporter substrate-binding protein [Thermoleophilaceae bacterium]
MHHHDHNRRRGGSRIAAGAALLALVAALSACSTQESGSSDASAKAEAAGCDKHLKVAWMFAGPRDDVGFNASHIAAKQEVQEHFGDCVEQVETDNVPFSDEGGHIVERFLNDGTDVVIDALGLAEITTDTCADYPDAHCLTIVGTGDLPDNVSGYYARTWLPQYAAGVAAGLTTETDAIGYVIAYDIPLIRGGVNAFVLGCREVNPDCRVRVININQYFAPPATARAATSLVDAGVDVLRGWLNDHSYCPVAAKRGVAVIPDYWEAESVCPKGRVTSTKYNWGGYYIEQLESIMDGTWEQRDNELISPDMFSLGEFGDDVEPAVREQVEEVFDQLTSGDYHPFVGPIRDTSGKLRVQDGERLDDSFLYDQWDWYVEGVVTGN